MTTPNLSIFLPAPALCDRVSALIEDNFQTMEVSNSGRAADIAFDGQIEKRRIIVRCGLEYAERFEDLDMGGFQAFWGFVPVDEIRIAAHSDTPVDHVLVARIAVLLAGEFGGVMDVGDRAAAPVAAGRLVALRAFDEGQPLSESASRYFCDDAFLTHWMQSPAFTLSK